VVVPSPKQAPKKRQACPVGGWSIQIQDATGLNGASQHETAEIAPHLSSLGCTHL